MNRSVRSVATAIAVGFAVYFAARAVWWTVQPSAPLLMVAAIVLYLVVIIASVLVDGPIGVRLPAWWGGIAIATGIVVPVLVSASLLPAHRTEPFATWFIGGVGLLAVVCIVRRRPVVGWLVMVVLIVTSSIYLGPLIALELGLVGSIMWAVVAHLLVLFWDRAVKDTEHLADMQRAVSAWHATQLVRQRERRVRVQYALGAAGPVLTKTIASGGQLTDDDRLEARLAEGRLRDELRGASLLNDAVRGAIHDVRLRGTAVTVFDEGGLDELDESRRDEIRNELADVISRAQAERVIIRAARDAQTAVTVVGRTGAGDSSDDDAVGLWHEIPRERRTDAAS
ncbi:hypothetical protein KEC56_11620 [Microbacterium sp. YMB-B2]|uniref:Uncharacterized protein n=1 Tax=Microbacterium tenebrionis TaxID=2830665 RepID=A0A9X1LQL4_9MICO|nr:DUF2781 domain-containing protein [Microbacterium tenebrionis]MCC2030154.1 hypothetical protein [Microbacterium tenebrionis]